MIPYRDLAYGLLEETVTTIIEHKDMKAMVCSPDGDTNFFNIVAGVLQGNTLAPYLSIIFLDYILRISLNLIKENDFSLKKETIMDAV